MITLSPEASAQIESFERYYIAEERPQALRNLAHALAEASLIILNAPLRGMVARGHTLSWLSWTCCG